MKQFARVFVWNISADNYARELRFGKFSHLQFCNEKKIFDFGFCFFVSGVVLGLFGPRPKPLDGSISLKFLLETRLKSESFDTLIDLVGFCVQKL